MPVSTQEEEARFAYLLQPIRDLTKNWDIDIAGQLKEYLSEIEQIAISFDGGATTMNFAEAALLIQGSACVYSKKVEYLHSLVYQVLDLLNNSKGQQKKSVSADGNTTVIQQNAEEFLSLDDTAPSDKNFTMDFYSLDDPLLTYTLPPAFEKKKEATSRDIPLLSLTGEVLGHLGDFIMNTSIFDDEARLLLDPSNLKLLEGRLERFLSFASMQTTEQQDTVTMTTDAQAPDVGDANDGPNLDISIADAPEPMDDLPEPQDNEEQQEEGRDRMQLRQRAPVQPVEAVPKPVIDPWAMDDPNEIKGSNKPFKKGKMYRVPGWLETNSNKKRKRGTGPLQSRPPLIPLINFINKLYSNESKYPSNPLKTPTMPDFDQMYWNEYKRRQSLMYKKRKQQGWTEEAEEEENNQNQEEEQEDPLMGVDPGQPVDDDDDEAPDIPDDVFHNYDGNMDRLHESNLEDALSDSPKTYEDLVRLHVDQYMTSAKNFGRITDLSKRVQEWEDKIVPTLQEEESHGPFDIHAYGTNIIDGIRTTDDIVIPFKALVEQKPVYQACRMFLATLQLANNYNVEIQSLGSLEKGMDTMSLKLLSDRRHFEELKEYRAPSAANLSQ